MKKFQMCALLSAVLAVSFSWQIYGADKREGKMKSLVVYYSYTGKTELVARTLAESIKADILKIEDVQRPSLFKAYFFGGFASTQGKSWPIKQFKQDLSGYERIFIGCPVWFGMPAPQINSFIEQANIKDKQIVVFVTMGGNGSEAALKAMTAKIAARSGKIVSSFSVKTGMGNKEDIVSTAKEIAKKY